MSPQGRQRRPSHTAGHRGWSAVPGRVRTVAGMAHASAQNEVAVPRKADRRRLTVALDALEGKGAGWCGPRSMQPRTSHLAWVRFYAPALTGVVQSVSATDDGNVVLHGADHSRFVQLMSDDDHVALCHLHPTAGLSITMTRRSVAHVVQYLTPQPAAA